MESTERTASVLSFEGHRQAFFRVAADLRRLRDLAAERGAPELADAVGEALRRAEEQRFTVAVVGEFKRGKSTLINALLGREVLPADILPTSATINRVTYGFRPGAQIFFRDGDGGAPRVESVPLEQLADYVTKLTPEAEAVALTVREAVITYPTPFCRNHVDILDTPGLSDDATMTRVTLDILPQADAAILVILATSPFAATEGDFLDSLLAEHGLGSVLFVVTALDRLRTDEERARVLDVIRQRIAARIALSADEHFTPGTPEHDQYLRRVGRPRIFGVSGYEALQAKLGRDGARLAASGFPDLEAALERFLTEESGLIALKTQTARVAGFCRELAAVADRQEALARERHGAFDASCEVFEAMLETVQRLGSDEQRGLDRVLAAAREAVRPWLDKLPARLTEAAAAGLEALPLTPAELFPEAAAALAAKLQQALRSTSENAAVALAGELESGARPRALDEARRLLSFAAARDRLLEHVAAELGLEAGFSPLTPLLGGGEGFAAAERGPALLRPGAAVARLTARLALPLDRVRPSEAPLAAGDAAKWVRKLANPIGAVRKSWQAAAGEEVARSFPGVQPAVAQAAVEVCTALFDGMVRALAASQEEAHALLLAVHTRRERTRVTGEQERAAAAQLRAEVERIRRGAESLAVQLSEI